MRFTGLLCVALVACGSSVEVSSSGSAGTAGAGGGVQGGTAAAGGGTGGQGAEGVGGAGSTVSTGGSGGATCPPESVFDGSDGCYLPTPLCCPGIEFLDEPLAKSCAAVTEGSMPNAYVCEVVPPNGPGTDGQTCTTFKPITCDGVAVTVICCTASTATCPDCGDVSNDGAQCCLSGGGPGKCVGLECVPTVAP